MTFHPSLSALVVLPISMAGYGLAFVLALGHGNPGFLATKIAWILSLLLIAIGFSITAKFHPKQFVDDLLAQAAPDDEEKRALWRRREMLCSIVTFAPLVALTAMSVFANSFNLFLGYVGGILCGISLFCSAQIYGTARAVPAWNTKWTPAFLLFSTMTLGTLIYLTFFGYSPGTTSNGIWAYLAIAFIILCWFFNTIWVRRARKFGFGQILNVEEGYLFLSSSGVKSHSKPTSEKVDKLVLFVRRRSTPTRKIFALLGWVMPLALLGLSQSLPSYGTPMQILATLCFFLALILERIMFFGFPNVQRVSN